MPIRPFRETLRGLALTNRPGSWITAASHRLPARDRDPPPPTPVPSPSRASCVALPRLACRVHRQLGARSSTPELIDDVNNPELADDDIRVLTQHHHPRPPN